MHKTHEASVRRRRRQRDDRRQRQFDRVLRLVPHRLDANTTVVTIDGVEAFDLISRNVMM